MKAIDEYYKYKVKSRQQLREFLDCEQTIYLRYMYPSKFLLLLGMLRREPTWRIMKWQRLSRIADYYDYICHTTSNKLAWLLYNYYSRCRNILAGRIGIEMSTALVGKGLVIYHYNNVVNGSTVIGDNCHIHGTVVVGNAGSNDLRTPVIGNNVMVGAGAKIIGNVTIADDIKIAAGAVVVTSFLEPGITIGGVPARKLK